MEKEYRYVVQRRFQTELCKKVGGALDRMFQHINGNSLHVLEEVSVLTAQKPIPKSRIEELCTFLLDKAREEGDTETLSFEVVPYNESLTAKAEASRRN